MQRTEINDGDYQTLLARITPIIMRKGLKSTTMDSVAAQLGMSKRTLYEIFGSKSQMLKEAIAYLSRLNQQHATEAFAKASNVMEAMLAVFKRSRDMVGSLNVEFYRDMDRLYKDQREEYDRIREENHEKMLQIFRKGVEQGMFRPDVDFMVQSRVMSLQMEAMKRIEELFPPDIPLLRVFDAIIIGFLRSIASPKGMAVLDEEIRKLSLKENKNNSITARK